MKKHLTFVAIAFLGISTLYSCTKSSSSSSSPYVMSVSKNGTTVSASGKTAVYAVVAGTDLQIYGETISGKDTSGFVFNIVDYAGAGTYSLSDSTDLAEYVSTNGTTASIIMAQSGTVVVKSATSSVVTGTFSFTGTDGTQFTNGTFNAAL
jgi:hypothetical protein